MERTLGELSEASGVTPRTIRFYIARGLLPAPVTAGRHARYDQRHLDRLARITAFKEAGHTLAEIGLRLDEESGSPPDLPEPVPMGSMMLSPDVQVLVRGDLPPWRLRQVRRILAEAARQLEALNPNTTHPDS